MTEIRPIAAGDRAWVAAALVRAFGADRMAVRGRLLRPAEHEGFIATEGDVRVGLVTYLFEAGQCEVTAIVAEPRLRGIGSQLLKATLDVAMANGCTRLWLITTNDNLAALRFYQRRGFAIAYVHRKAVNISREKLKPEIPVTGQHGIPLQDELELELKISERAPWTGGIFAPERLRFGMGVGGIVTRGSSVLMVHHYLKGDHDFWVMPGGGLDDGETLPDGVRREVLEETGLDVSADRLAYVEQFFEGHGRSFKLWFACRERAAAPLTHAGNPAVRETVVEARFLTREQISELIVYPEIVRRDEFWLDLAAGFPAVRMLENRTGPRA